MTLFTNLGKKHTARYAIIEFHENNSQEGKGEKKKI